MAHKQQAWWDLQAPAKFCRAYTCGREHSGCISINPAHVICMTYGNDMTLHLQGLSNIVWAYAKLGALPNARTGGDESSGLEARGKGNVGSLFDALAVEAVSQLMDARCSHKFIPQNLSNMVYG